MLQYAHGKEEESCFVCKRTVEDYNTYVTKSRNLDFAEKDDIMGEMDSLPVILVGNTYVSLCPICYELTFGFSTDPDERLKGIKKYMGGEIDYHFENKFNE